MIIYRQFISVSNKKKEEEEKKKAVCITGVVLILCHIIPHNLPSSYIKSSAIIITLFKGINESL